MSESATELGPIAEQGWQDLAVHVHWHPDRFWVAWVFADDPRVVREYQRRMAELLARSGRVQQVLQPDTQQAVRAALEPVLSEDTRAAHCLWLEVLRSDIVSELTTGEHPWQDAWAWLMSRANEHRGRISRHLPGGLIFVGMPAYKARTAAAAPDMWSIRALVLEPESLPGPTGDGIFGMDVPDGLYGELGEILAIGSGSSAARDPDVALLQAARMGELGDRAGEAKALLRASKGLLQLHMASDDSAERAEFLRRAVAAGARAIEHLRALAADNPARHELVLARELCWLALAQTEVGQLDDARAAADDALSLARENSEGEVGLFLVCQTLVVVAYVANRQRRHNDEVIAWTEVVAIGSSLPKHVPVGQLVQILIILTTRQGQLGHLSNALASSQEATRRARAHLEEDRNTMLPLLVRALLWTFFFSYAQGKHTDGDALLDEVRALTDDLLTEHPAVKARDIFLKNLGKAIQTIEHL